jgi:hypothetical protein
MPETLQADFYRTVKRRYCRKAEARRRLTEIPLPISEPAAPEGFDRGAHTTFVERLALQYLP